MEAEVFQNTQQMIERSDATTRTQSLNELLGDSDEFALLRETLWIYSQIVESK